MKHLLRFLILASAFSLILGNPVFARAAEFSLNQAIENTLMPLRNFIGSLERIDVKQVNKIYLSGSPRLILEADRG